LLHFRNFGGGGGTNGARDEVDFIFLKLKTVRFVCTQCMGFHCCFRSDFTLFFYLSEI